MNEQEYRLLIKMITQEIVKRIKSQDILIEKRECQNSPFFQTIILVPGPIPFYKKAIDNLYQEYGTEIGFLAADSRFVTGVKNVFHVDELPQNEMMSLCENAEQVVLLSPSLSMLSRIANDDDKGIMEYLFLHSFLWNKEVSIYLDFHPEKVHSITYNGQSKNLMSLFHSRKIPVYCYCNEQKAISNKKTISVKETSLITETDVLEFFQAGRRRFVCESNSIVTPLARDKANELGIILQETGG